MKNFEDIFRRNGADKPHIEISESEAEDQLEELITLPENRFLIEVDKNREVIESAESAREALAFAQGRIRERIESTLAIRKAVHGHVESVHADAEAVATTIHEVRAHAVPIGEGADGRVIIDSRNTSTLNPEVCYKFALAESLKRGRNSMVEEIELQSAFYDAAAERADTRIGVPEPYFEVDIGDAHMIVMERLHARSVDDILRGFGTLPKGFDVDEFCDALSAFLDDMHAHGLYHRDLHYGNIMVTQDSTEEVATARPLGYVIDFGLSGYAQGNEDPYRKEVAGTAFTYDKDHGRIESVRSEFKHLLTRQSLGI